MARCLKSLRSKLPAVSSSPSLPVTLDVLKCLNPPLGKRTEPLPSMRIPCAKDERALIALQYFKRDQPPFHGHPLRLGSDDTFAQTISSQLNPTTYLICTCAQSENVRNDLVVKAEGVLARGETHKDEPRSGPSDDQLDHVFQILSKELPDLFVRRLTFDIYNLDMVFENNIRGTRTVGLHNYATTISMLKLIGHLRFAYIGLDLIKITKHPEDGTVKARWRIRGLGGLRVMFLFWKQKIWKWQEILGSHETWYDGFSTFHVGSDGKIYRHVADKVMPDRDQEEIKTTPITGKVALLFGLTGVPRPSLSDMILSLFGGKKRSNLIKS